MFAGWAHSLDDDGDDVYTNADGSISVLVYYVFGYTIIDISVEETGSELPGGGESENFPSEELAAYFPESGIPALEGATSYEFEGQVVAEADYAEFVISATFEDADAAEAAAESYATLLDAAGYHYDEDASGTGYNSYINDDRTICIDVSVEGNEIEIYVWTYYEI